jgi:hypothetical protein
MKSLFFASLFLTSACFADSFDKDAFKTLLTQNQSSLEKINVGMSKRLVTHYKKSTEVGDCLYSKVVDETVMSIEAERERMIVYSLAKTVPVVSEACTKAEIKNFEERMLSYESKPSLKNDLADLDKSEVTTISRDADLVKMEVSGADHKVEQVTYDLRKPSYRNLISMTQENESMTSTDLADLDVNTVDLKNILFCDEDECSQGDFSDILF